VRVWIGGTSSIAVTSTRASGSGGGLAGSGWGVARGSLNGSSSLSPELSGAAIMVLERAWEGTGTSSASDDDGGDLSVFQSPKLKSVREK
jgi:hypothetical protein